jgi:hypothetical protein
VTDRREAKSYKERIDPGGEQEQMARFFGSPVGRLLGRVAKVPPGQVKGLVAQYERLTTEPDRIAAALAPLGWIFFESAPFEEYALAATLIEQGHVAEADELLVKKWNDDEMLLKWPVHRLVGLYGGEEERIAIREARQRLLSKALELHRGGEYAAAIPIVLAQIDGVFIDFTSKPAKEFFDPRNPHLVDEVTLAGHPLGLQALSKLMSQTVKTTTTGDTLSRHGILHGRVLGYDTVENATKVWTALLAVNDALKPRADELNERLRLEREARFAGSKELDEEGRRLDRRGFDAAKKLLFDISAYQYGVYQKRQRYAAGRDELDPSGNLLGAHEFELRTSDDAQEYWAWVVTPTGVVFGMAGRGGDHPVWQYQGEEPPEGGINSDADWRHVARDSAPPEWQRTPLAAGDAGRLGDMARLCIFCGEGKPTREHVIPAWLSDVLPGDGDFNFTRQQEDGSVSSWSTSALNLTVKRVCGPCNHGWMSELEERIKPLLTPLIHGQAATFGRDEQSAMARWTTKMAIVVEQTRSGEPMIPPDYRRHVREREEPPPGTHVWMARYGGGRTVWFDRFDGNLASSQKSGHVHALTLSLGQLVLQVYSLLIERPEEIAIEKATLLPELWPNQSERVAWPPVIESLDDAAMQGLAKSLLIGQQMLGGEDSTAESLR